MTPMIPSASGARSDAYDEVALRHDAQWQYRKVIGGSVASKHTLVHRQVPFTAGIGISSSLETKVAVRQVAVNKTSLALFSITMKTRISPLGDVNFSNSRAIIAILRRPSARDNRGAQIYISSVFSCAVGPQASDYGGRCLPMLRVSACLEPNVEVAERYGALLEIYRDVYDASHAGAQGGSFDRIANSCFLSSGDLLRN